MEKIKLKIGPPVFSITPSWKDKAIILGWAAKTDLANVIWHRIVVLKLGWPPFRRITTFLPEKNNNRQLQLV